MTLTCYYSTDELVLTLPQAYGRTWTGLDSSLVSRVSVGLETVELETMELKTGRFHWGLETYLFDQPTSYHPDLL